MQDIKPINPLIYDKFNSVGEIYPATREDLQIAICMAQSTERQICLNEKILMNLRKE